MIEIAPFDILPGERDLLNELHKHGLLQQAITTSLAEQPLRQKLVRGVMLQLVESRNAPEHSAPVPDISERELLSAVATLRSIQAALSNPMGSA